MHPKDADRMANSADPDQTSPLIWVYTALFAWACLSENLATLCIYMYIWTLEGIHQIL